MASLELMTSTELWGGGGWPASLHLPGAESSVLLSQCTALRFVTNIFYS